MGSEKGIGQPLPLSERDTCRCIPLHAPCHRPTKCLKRLNVKVLEISPPKRSLAANPRHRARLSQRVRSSATICPTGDTLARHAPKNARRGREIVADRATQTKRATHLAEWLPRIAPASPCFVLCALCFVLCALCFVLCALCFVLGRSGNRRALHEGSGRRLDAHNLGAFRPRLHRVENPGAQSPGLQARESATMDPRPERSPADSPRPDGPVHATMTRFQSPIRPPARSRPFRPPPLVVQGSQG
ncbi:hypothetical protein BH23VER1_BH23VER1_09200 [soil metagenome]